MPTPQSLEERLIQLGEEIGTSQGFAERVRKELDAECRPVTHRSPRVRKWKLWTAGSGLTVVTVFVAMTVWWFAQPRTLAARMLAAMQNARTVHATGWTRRVVRKWPLEQPGDAKPDESQQHSLEAWFWTDADGTHRSYEKQGPVILTRRGGDFREYQPDADLTYIYTGGYNKNRGKRFSQLGEYLARLERPSLTKEELGTRREKGRTLRGLRHVEGNRVTEVWLDEQSLLPVQMKVSHKDSGRQMLELEFRFDEPVPDSIVSFTPPETKHVRHGGSNENVQLVWRNHVKVIGERLQAESAAGGIALIPRENNRSFDHQWLLRTPDGSHWVVPLDRDQYLRMDMNHFVRLRAATKEGERRHGTWRMPSEFHDLEFPRADLVYEAGTPWQDWVQFALNQLGLEFVDQDEERTIWIAEHDGRPLKPWQEVKPPVPYVVEGGVEKKGYVAPGIGHILRPVTMAELLNDFNRLIDYREFSADKPWIVDKTGLPHEPPMDPGKYRTGKEYWDKVIAPNFLVATDSPWFVGEESLQMARDWYQKEFGITFKEEVESATVHVIRRRRDNGTD